MFRINDKFSKEINAHREIVVSRSNGELLFAIVSMFATLVYAASSELL